MRKDEKGVEEEKEREIQDSVEGKEEEQDEEDEEEQQGSFLRKRCRGGG